MLSAGAGVFLFLGFVWGRSALSRYNPSPLDLEFQPARILADGYATATLTVSRRDARPPEGPLRLSIQKNIHGATVEDVAEIEHGWRARIRAGVLPGPLIVRAEAPGFSPASAELTLTPAATDRHADGTPDFLRLEDEHDELAFRRWFTFLAEAQFFQQASARPAEINDCAALIRYAYREALRLHDSRWAADAQLPIVPGLESISKYQYPFTPMGAALFRVRPGPYRPSDAASGAFAQFADAQTLQRLNTHFITRTVARATPGDLLFSRRLTDHMPFHSMIFLGRSQFTNDRASFLLYHTGPDGSNPGEIRRVTLDELMRHPDPQWHAIEGNPNFLGVYRWNILRKAD